MAEHGPARSSNIIRLGGGIHSLESGLVKENVGKLKVRMPKVEQIRLPEDVEDVLYGVVKSGVEPNWRNKVTLALTQGTFPDGITAEDIVSRVRGERR